MTRSHRWLALGALALAFLPAPLAAQTSLVPLPTRELYTRAREKAARVNDRCVGSRADYQEALSYLYAYYQVASRDGSLKSAPEFDRAIQQQFYNVLRATQQCLDLVEASSASMRSDGSEATQRVAPPPGVGLPDPPPPGAEGGGTDAEGRTIPQLLQEIEQLKQERIVWAAEIQRLRSLQPPPPPPAANLSGEYRIRVKASGLFWHEDGNGDRKISTRYQPNDDYTRFILELQPDGSYRIRVKATNRYLHAPGHADWILSTLAQVDDDYTRFFLEPHPDGSVRIRQKATGRYIGQGGDGVLTNAYPQDDDFIRFWLYR